MANALSAPVSITELASTTADRLSRAGSADAFAIAIAFVGSPAVVFLHEVRVRCASIRVAAGQPGWFASGSLARSPSSSLKLEPFGTAQELNVVADHDHDHAPHLGGPVPRLQARVPGQQAHRLQVPAQGQHLGC